MYSQYRELDWIEVQLSDIGHIVTGKTPNTKTREFYDGGIPFIKPGDLNEGRSIEVTETTLTEKGIAQVQEIPSNSITVTCIGNLGKIGLTKQRCATNQQINSILPSKFIYPKFTYYQLHTLKEWLETEASATTVQIINKTKFSQAPFILPPLAEQKAIADKLDTLLAQVDTIKARLDRIPDILKRFRQSVLTAAVSGKLSEDFRETCKCENSKSLLRSIHEYKKEWLSTNFDHNESKKIEKRLTTIDLYQIEQHRIPSWSISKLEDLLLMIVDCHNKTAPYADTGIALVRTSNIRNGKFNWDKLKFVSEDTFLRWSKRCQPLPGDIIFTREAPMGELAIIPPSKKICLGQRTMLFRPIEHLIQAKYLKICLMDPVFRRRSEKKSVGSGVQHYRVRDVSDLEIPVPPKVEQDEIVRRVEQLFGRADKIEQQTQAALTHVNQLTQSILAKAFRGELTAQWRKDNPDLITGENSAQALLEKIKAERAAAKPVKKTRKKKAST